MSQQKSTLQCILILGHVRFVNQATFIILIECVIKNRKQARISEIFHFDIFVSKVYEYP